MNTKVNIFLALAVLVLFSCKKDQVQDSNPSSVVISSSTEDSNSLTNGRKSAPVISEGINGSNTGDDDRD